MTVTSGCGCPCGMCAKGHCDKCWGRGPHTAPGTCTGCHQLRPCLFTLIDPEGVHRRCLACHYELAAAAERAGSEIVFMVRPVATPIRGGMR